ncbi:serine/threonine-protein kinase [Nonomuraea sp. NPDC050556]|uniref:serine/threonine-protein kinase n=1 Tax=Nonomuraea sp. NPDC050556 TaxID=3364369 RepID=UPI00378FB6C2
MEGRLVGGRYRLAGELGRGGMGAVWRAHDELLDRPVALKEVLLPQWVTPEDREQTFARVLREARAAARLRHPSVVTVYDVVTEDGHPWIAMELLPAVSLEERIRSSGPLPEREAARIGLQVLDALRVAHAAGIMHRDIKPANVMLLDDGGVVLTDFGIAQIEGDSQLTASGMLVGSPGFMAPERIQGVKAGAAADLWSLGATLYSAVEGRQPFHRSTPMAVLAAVLTQPQEPMTKADLLRPVIEGLLEKDAAVRMTHADAATALKSVHAVPQDATHNGGAAEDAPEAGGPKEGGLTEGGSEGGGTRALPVPQPVQRGAVVVLGLSGALAVALAGWEAVSMRAFPTPLFDISRQYVVAPTAFQALLVVLLGSVLAVTFMLGSILDPVFERFEWVYAFSSVVALAAAAAVWPLRIEVPGLWRIAYGALCVWLLMVALSTWQRSRPAAILLAVSGLLLADTALSGGQPGLRGVAWVLYACWAGLAIARITLRSGRQAE